MYDDINHCFNLRFNELTISGLRRNPRELVLVVVEMEDLASFDFFEFFDDGVVPLALEFDRADKAATFPTGDPFEEFFWIADHIREDPVEGREVFGVEREGVLF